MLNLILGDCLEKLKEIESNSIGACITDPPYGFSFMGKKWDYSVPSVDIWKEVFRVLKPGAHVLSFGGTRTYHRMVVNMEDAGFEIRDQVMWLQGQGFPKSHNLKDEWKGWGSALKPANEPICLARKPLEKGLTIAENVIKYGTGAINVDGCRIESSDQKLLDAAVERMSGNKVTGWVSSGCSYVKPISAQGRWPANVILDEEAGEMLDGQSGLSKSNDKRTGEITESRARSWKNTSLKGIAHQGYIDQGGASRFFYCAKTSKSERNMGLDRFDCIDIKSNPCEENTEQVISILKAILESIHSLSIALSGNSIMVTCPKECTFIISMAMKVITESKTWSLLTALPINECTKGVVLNQMDGISHVNSVVSLSELTTLIGTLHEKVGSLTDDVKLVILKKLLPLSERNDWKELTAFHPTIKPIRLMEYLCKLITPPNGTILDPFMGSGSTGIAAKNLGFHFTGIELNEEYFEIAKRRINAVDKQ